MIGLIFGIIYLWTAACIVKKFRRNAFRGSDGEELFLDIGLTILCALTVAPIVVCLYAFVHLLGVAGAVVGCSRRS